MSHDGSSAKSYIRHPTEKERLDNLAFASFPEDYLPYTANAGHHRSAQLPPYLLWGDDRRRKPTPRRKKRRCAGALLCAIVLVICAILAVVAISVYLGVVTNLFRSPVLSVSGRFRTSGEFSNDLLNSSSRVFQEKADALQTEIERAFLSSSLEPAFIATRIYAFNKPGLTVFFRVYLDRRKIVQSEEEDSKPTELVKNLVSLKLTDDPKSVQIEEHEDLLSATQRSTVKPLNSTTNKPFVIVPQAKPKESRPLQPAGAGVGHWHPVPIEDSVSPSFADRPPAVLSPAQPPEETRRANSPRPVNVPIGVASVRVLEENPLNVHGSEETRKANFPQPVNPPLGVGSVRILEENPSKIQPLEETRKFSSPQPINPSLGVGSVRILEESSPNSQPEVVNSRELAGFVRFLEDARERNPKLPDIPKEGVGSIRLLKETPQKNTRPPSSLREGIGTVHVLEETPQKAPGALRSSENVGFIRAAEEPPTLNPSVSLMVRNRTRSDRPRNLAVTFDKDNNSGNGQNVGVGLIREILTEVDDFLPPSGREDLDISSSVHDSEDIPDNNTFTNKDTTNKELTFKKTAENGSSDITALFATSEKFSTNQESNTDETSQTIVSSESTRERLMSDVPEFASTQSSRASHLETILFSHPTQAVFVTKTNTEPYSTDSGQTSTLPNDFTKPSTNSTMLEDIFSSNSTSFDGGTTESEEDIHSSIVNHSQYPTPEPHFHAIEKERNASLIKPHSDVTMEELTLYHTVLPNNSSQDHELPIEDSLANDSEVVENSSNLESILNLNDSSKIDGESGMPSTSNFEQYSTTEELGNSTNITSEEDVLSNDTSQQAKVVPQMQPDFSSNDIASEQNAGDNMEEDEFVGDLIIRHITTLSPQTPSKETPTQLCPPNSIPCKSGGCGVKCDMRRDCTTNEDEENCKCADLLRSMGQSQKVCDGIDDCSDGSDESDCPWCDGEDVFRCPGSRTCIPMSRVCDRKNDCPGAQDERRCVALANSSSDAETGEYHPKGYLIVRNQGQWGKLCLESLAQSPDLNQRIRELGRAVCSVLTYRNMTSSIRVRDDSHSQDQYFHISGETINNGSSTPRFESTSCSAKEVLKVECRSLECGVRPFAASSQRRRIVGGQSAGGHGAWPWAAALYREGEFQCGAALVADQWLVSAAHCFYSSQGAYWTVRLGFLRRGSELPSSGERVRRIESMILHPQYEDNGFINDIVLLRMDRPVSFSDTLRPICLPLHTSEDATIWHGRRCSVVGWGKLYEIGHTFPDSLQEVRLPVISSAECQRRSLFLPAYRITPRMFCAGYERGGRDACLGDSGGPMACQRPSDGRWVLLGVTSNGDGCGRPGRPGVYTQVASYLNWIRETIQGNAAALNKIAGSESLCIGGVRCRLGRCVPQSKVCDGQRDCAGGEDEEGC